MSKNELPPPAGLLAWGATLATMRECDEAAGITDPGTQAATAALGRALQAQGGTA